MRAAGVAVAVVVGCFTLTGITVAGVATGLTNGTAYTFTVTATNDVGTGTASSASSAATPTDTPEPIIVTVAGTGSSSSGDDGGQATATPLTWPIGVAVDASGNLYIADLSEDRIRKVTTATGVITTVAGSGTGGYAGDGGVATAAQLNLPKGVAVDTGGNVYIADTSNHRIRKVTATSGLISLVAGSGVKGFSGDGAEAFAAQLSAPARVAVDTTGNVYIMRHLARCRRLCTPVIDSRSRRSTPRTRQARRNR